MDSGDCSENYPDGTVVTLTAAADFGSNFSGWSGYCTRTGDCVVMRDTLRDITVDGNTLKNSEGGGIEMYPHSPGYFYNDASMSVGYLVVLDNEITDSCAGAPFSFKIRGVNTQYFVVLWRLYVTRKVTKDVHTVHYFHAVVPHLHQNCTKHEEGKATIILFQSSSGWFSYMINPMNFLKFC